MTWNPFMGVPRRGVLMLLGFSGILALAPLVVDQYLLSVILITLYFAYVGMAWNLMMGFAGQLSLGHSLYVGLGAYASAAMFVHFGLPPLFGMVVGMAVAMVAGSAVGVLAFRFGIGGVYFALLTIAFAEFTRILFEHFEWVGATAGFFLPVKNLAENDLWNLRGSSTMFYYVILVMTLGGLGLIKVLMGTRLGFYWLAIREDQEAAQALGINTFRCKMAAIMLSAAMAALGGVFLAFYNNNLFPSDIFSMHRSIGIILAPIIGGLGTLFGPILGAFVLTPLGEVLTWGVEEMGLNAAGAKQLAYGVIVLMIIKFRPSGVWPWLARHLGLEGKD